jgi:hypothetical protein
MRGGFATANLTRGLVAIQLRHLTVHEDRIKGFALERCECFLTIHRIGARTGPG